jgi:hypothetical protein
LDYYRHGSTPSVAGRLGFLFPLERIAKKSDKQPTEAARELSTIQVNLEQLQKDVNSRDQQIAELRE